MLQPEDITAIALTLELALITTCCLLLIGTPLAWWLARHRFPGHAALQTLIALPLVLPPTVMGFYLLLILAPNTAIGSSWQALTGQQLAFSFEALIIGSILYSLPFVVQPLQAQFERLPADILEAAATLGAGPLDRCRHIIWPYSRNGFITAAILGFAHTIGEFGVILMIGGNIPGQTRVVSIALYDHVESLQYQQAHTLAAGLVLFSFAILWLVYRQQRRNTTLTWKLPS